MNPTRVPDQPAPLDRPERVACWDMVIAYTGHRWNVDRVADVSAVSHGPGVKAAILADMIERHRVGTERHGTPLTAGNGRDHLIDAYQEALDFAVYLVAELDERGLWVTPGQPRSTSTKADSELWFIFDRHMAQIWDLRALIYDRDAEIRPALALEYRHG